MKKNILTLVLLLISTSLFGCSFVASPQQPNIMTITDPQQLDQDLRDNTIYLEKWTVNYENVVSIFSLDQGVNERYVLPRDQKHNGIILLPDNRHIVYTRIDSKEEETYLGTSGVYINDLHTNEEIKLSGWDVDMSDILLQHPSYSPKNDLVSFDINWPDPFHVGFGTVDFDGNNLRILESNLHNIGQHSYSPDGENILVSATRLDDFNGIQLCLLDNNGRFIRYLTNGGDYNGPFVYTPDGEHIIYVEIEWGGFLEIFKKTQHNVYIMGADGTKREHLLRGRMVPKGFSDDGSELIFLWKTNHSEPFRIYIMDIDGSNLRHLAYLDEYLEEWYSDEKDFSKNENSLLDLFSRED